MNKHEYAEEVCKYVNERGYHTEITDHHRNNGSYVAISVRRSEHDKVAPIFPVGDESEDPVIFAKHIMEFVPAKIDTETLADVMADKESVLNRCYYVLVNSELNKDRDTLVKRQINKTLELQFKIDISDILDDCRVTLEHKHIERLGIDENELYVRSYANTMEKYPYCLQTMAEVLPCDILEEVPQMYVLTNNTKTNGAGAVLYKGIKEVLENKVGEDAILIPSSVHEWIVIPSYLGEKEIIAAMIRDVNSSVLSPEDILSDRPYELISDGVLFEL